jgi:aspartyl-tRNA(Asn)/glutamyl-tRNA(Gln) amidotransferase subunit A
MNDITLIEKLGTALRQVPGGCRQLVEATFEQIAAYDGKLNSVSVVLTERALAIADELDAELARGNDRGLLHGIPFGIKEVFDVQGAVTTAGCPPYARRRGIAGQDAALVAKLIAAGAIPIAKTQTNDLAYGLDGCNPNYGNTYNPWDLSRISGGSSSGSGAAVCAGLLPFALGTDTGGSIRVPSAYMGITGIRATHGQDQRGMVPLAPIFDTIGAMARRAKDVARVQAILRDEPFPTELFAESPQERLKHLQIGVVEDAGLAQLPPATLTVYKESLLLLEAAGVQLQPVNLPGFASDEAIQTFTVLQHTQALYHARDRFAEDAATMDPATRTRLERGATFSAIDYIQAEQTRHQLTAQVRATLTNLDALLLPIAPLPAPLPGDDQFELAGQSISLRGHILRLCCIGALSGHPIAAVPAGLCQGLPLGWQVLGHRNHDLFLLSLADAIQLITAVPFQPIVHAEIFDHLAVSAPI